MGPLSKSFRKMVVFHPQPQDVKMMQTSRASGVSPTCDCLNAQYGKTSFEELTLHSELQDTNCDGWKMLLDLIETAASKRSNEFAPGLEMPPDLWSQIITLPPSISKLTSVRTLFLYGSHLVRIPPEIGEMSKLEGLDVYTSYRLHWLPYEVTHCSKLATSRFSTRALYGNYKYRPPFPKLGDAASSINVSNRCSVCRQSCALETVRQVWISLRVATDVLPLLVNACSEECISRLPPAAHGYVDRPHAGGLGLEQPAANYV